MWNEFLNQSRSEHKFQNTNLIILGSRHSGKRSLIDSLFQISKTTFHNKKLASQTQTNRMRLKGVTTAIDYAYLNVLDLNDIDYRTHTKLEVYMIEDHQNPQLYKELSNPKILSKSVMIIMLDFTNPWNFMSQLDKWVKFIYELQKNAGLKITQLQDMKNKIQDYYRSFKQPQFDQFGKLKRNFQKVEQNITIPIPDGVLAGNLRIPFILCVNKCDLQSSVLRDESANKITFVLYHLRKFCIHYGGTLIYTSIRSNSNLNVLYEYILHRSYNMPLRYKAESISEENIFIPLGFDNLNLLNDSVLKMDVSKPYQQIITAPVQKKNMKEQIIVEQDSKFFQKYATVGSTPSVPTTGGTSQTIKDQQSQQQQNQPTQVQQFFKSLLSRGGTNTTLPPEDRLRRNNAEKLLIEKAAQIEQKKQQQKQ